MFINIVSRTSLLVKTLHIRIFPYQLTLGHVVGWISSSAVGEGNFDIVGLPHNDSSSSRQIQFVKALCDPHPQQVDQVRFTR